MKTGIEMSMEHSPTIADAIRDSCRRMLQLLDDPQPGLFTWQEAVKRESDRLKGLLP